MDSIVWFSRGRFPRPITHPALLPCLCDNLWGIKRACGAGERSEVSRACEMVVGSD